MNVRILPSNATDDMPADARIAAGPCGGVVVITHAFQTPTLHALQPFLQTLDTLWGMQSASPSCAAPADTQATASDDAESPLLVVVEDNEINRDVTLRQLALLGIRALAAPNGRAGYRAWRRQQPRAMLVDCHMPIVDGYDLARRIRIREMAEGRPRTVLIGFSANATSRDAQACLAAGMDDYVSKPATRVRLLEALQRTGLEDLINP